MEKQPTLSTAPACLGISYRSISACSSCPFRGECAALTEERQQYLSLEQQLAEVEEELRAGEIGGTAESIEQIYDRLYIEYFGQPSRRKRSERNDATFDRVLAMTLHADIDPATWIAAQMSQMRGWLSSQRKLRFMPNMLLGEKAKGRYNAHIRKANRMTKRRRVDGVLGGSTMGEVRRDLIQAETMVGEYFVAARVAGVSLSWEQAQSHFTLPKVWKDFSSQQGLGYLQFASVGKEVLERERLYMRLSAACAVARHYRWDLPSRLGFRDFAWEPFADLLATLFHPASSVSTPSADLGAVWHRGAAL